MNHCFRSALLLLLSLAGIATDSFAQDASTLNPKHRYLTDAATLSAGEVITGASRVLDLKGRKGTVALWFFALEDLGASFLADQMKMDNPHFATYAFLSDFETPRDVAEANFTEVKTKQ